MQDLEDSETDATDLQEHLAGPEKAPQSAKGSLIAKSQPVQHNNQTKQQPGGKLCGVMKQKQNSWL